jgi:hypothetical protein
MLRQLASAAVLSPLRRAARRVLPAVEPLDRRAIGLLAAVVAVGALLRVIWTVGWASEPVGGLDDPALYRHLAERIADGHGYTYGGDNPGPTAYDPPGYPYALGVLVWLVRLLPGPAPTTFEIAVSFNIVLSVLTIAAVFELGRRLVSVPVGLVAAGVLAFWPNAIIHTGLILTETLFLFLFSLVLLVALPTPAVARRPGVARMITTGLLLGAVGLVRPISFVVAPLFLLLWWRDGAAMALRRIAWVGAAVLVMVLPWSVRNTIRMEAPVLISTNLGDNLCIGNNRQADGNFSFDANSPCFRGITAGDRPESETYRQSKTFERAWEYIKEEPFEAVVFNPPAKLRYTLDRDTDGLWTSTSFGASNRFSPTTFERLELLTNVYYAVVAVVGLVGSVILWVRSEPMGRRMFFLLAAVVQLVPVLVTFGDPRFKMPLYPALAVGVGVAVVTLVQRRPPALEVPAA